MENNEFGKVKEWLEESRNKLEDMFNAGEVPVVGWLKLAETMKNSEPCQRKLEAEMDENTREREEVAAQIRILQTKQQELEEKNKDLHHKMKRMEQIGMLVAESQSIALLGNKEGAWVAKVEEKMKNEYFMEHFDSEDVSTVFSMFNMDILFSRFRENEPDNNLDIIRVTPVADLQKDMAFDFPETVELIWKLNLLEKGEKESESHLAKCSICRTSKLGSLLKEYGMPDADSKAMEAKMEGWRGYFLATVNGPSAALALGVEKAKLASCLMRIQRVHQW